nr:GlxA family transcriptional regulator [Sinorhizobium fredii]
MRFCIFVQDGFSILAFSLVVGALHAANRACASEIYRWSVSSVEGGPVVSDSGICLPTDDMGVMDRSHLPETGQNLVLICDGGFAQETRRRIANWSRRVAAYGGRVVAIGDASQLLAEAGLLAGRRCAAHWRDYAVMAEKYPSVQITRHYFEVDGPFYTSPGEMATFDLMLRMVEQDCGAATAEQIGLQSLPSVPRKDGDRQCFPDVAQLEKLGSPLARIVEKMHDHIAEPLPLGRLIKEVPLSRRQVERHFVSEFGMPPKRFYRQLRLERARELLNNSMMSVLEVAIATGFVSASHFSKTYRVAFGESPTETRRSPGTAPPDSEVTVNDGAIPKDNGSFGNSTLVPTASEAA